MKATTIFLSFMILAMGPASGDPGESGQNIAKGKKVALEPAPDYPHCTDAGDSTQITDGILTEGYFWTQKGTVGWSGVAHATITIDLERVEPISGVSYRTAAGVAGVSFPVSIWILLSDDGKTYYLAGDLVALAEGPQPPAEGYAVHRYASSKIESRGRWVKLIVAGGQYTFTDEIEVFRGPAELLEKPPSGKPVDDAGKFITEMMVTSCLRRRLSADLAAVTEAFQAARLDDPFRVVFRKMLDATALEIPKAEAGMGTTGKFSTVFPVNDLHREIFLLQADLWNRMGHKGLVVWQKDRWDPLSPTEPPRGGGAGIGVAMMQNETRGAAFNMSRARSLRMSPQVGAEPPPPTTVKLRIVGLPGGTNPRYVSVHEVLFTDTQSGTPVAAAMPLARQSDGFYLVDVPLGLTRQVWLSFNSGDLAPGDYTGIIVLAGEENDVPLRLKVYPLKFPEAPALHLGGWDYTDRDACYGVTPENRAAFIRHLRERFVDTPWAQSSVLARGKHDAEGNMTEPPDAREFEEWVRRWPGARNYYVFVSVGGEFAGFEMGSPPFKVAVSAWISWWVDKLRGRRIEPRQLGLLLVDEPRAAEQDKIIIEYARVLRAAQPEVVIWEDPIWGNPAKATPEMFELCHVLCPNLPMWLDGGKEFADFYLRQKQAGRKLWLYSCSGPGKLLDPYSYHRMQHWFCWKVGAEGSGFWAFGDTNGASSYNEYLTTVGSYTPAFIDEKSVTPGKHMEAIREGVEDYEYLRMLRDRIAELEAKGGSAAKGEAIERARKLLVSGPDRVTACMTSSRMTYWKEPKDRSIADKVRLEILEALMSLREE
jgi:hypothetical protein